MIPTHPFELPPSATMREAMRKMVGPPSSLMIMVVDGKRRLLGVVVDSDLRKAMLCGLPLSAPLSQIMNAKPFTLPCTLDRSAICEIFRKTPRNQIPLVDERGRVTSLAYIGDYLSSRKERPNWVVLLVGGAGRRLHPLTRLRPKPLLPVGDKPLLETILEQFSAAGFHNFILAINRHADQFRSHFGDGSRLGLDIRYVHERKPLGTAGALSLLPGPVRDPLIVMNGDLLTKVNFENLLDFHKEEGCLATLCVREYDFQVPFGVIRMEGHRLLKIIEKPTHRFFVNAGIYVLEPSVLGWIPKNRRFDMPDLLAAILKKRHRSIGCFPIREYWIDIGRMGDYERAQEEFPDHFSPG
ncbi:MAG TPA: alcohol dehydrogenase [Elusimicrobia bacterium]|nr:alcohol dehydrogenase [Elusimicrobiota bacterium]